MANRDSLTCLAVAAVLALPLSSTVATETAANASSLPCQSDPGHTDFDFWVGDWTVTSTKDGTYLGRNKITKEAAGCLLVEQWHGQGGAYGRSLNYYNPSRGVWRQLWVDNAGYSIDYEGGIEDGAMVLEGTFFFHADGREVGFRGTWTPLEGGAVRQQFHVKQDDGSWSLNWDARYDRADSTDAEDEVRVGD